MIRTSLNYQCIFVSGLVLDLFCQVASEFCGNDITCQSPYTCCINKQACCYDHENNGYTRGFKLHVWNMWYFWLVIIFILMSCFGGCGYYRRRRLAAMQQSMGMPQTATVRPVCTARTRRQPQPGFYAYTGPGSHSSPDSQLPPPYTEVMQQPNLYPVNKVDLPPYPGPPINKDSSAGMDNGDDEVSPPPYYQVAALSSQPPQGENSPIPREYIAVPVETASSQQHGRGEPVDRTSQPASSS
ncbi:uncharacterized protein [Littorina saxatilis]|uniref:WW domain binding protein VOPP1 n=1 Tax=Littorina saxatilis TaxID=31220 RepID=A0AAN9BQB6_9CAEN